MEEIELVRRMKFGDRSAFDKIYEMYRNSILRAAYLICSDRYEAEDIMQETFVTCWLHVRELRKESSFRFWLFRIMTQIARKKARENAKYIPNEKILELADFDSSKQAFNSEYDTLLGKNMVEKALQSLEQQYKEVIVLYYYEEMSVKEVAKTLQLFEGTVKSRLFTARAKMKSAMQRSAKEDLRYV